MVQNGVRGSYRSKSSLHLDDCLTFSTFDVQTFRSFRPSSAFYCVTIASSSPPFRQRKDLCLQTAHVAVDAFPNRSLSLSLAATSKVACFPSVPRPCCLVGTARVSSRPTNSPPSRNW